MESIIQLPQPKMLPFWHTKLPLLLIPIVLLAFNYFLYTRLQVEAVDASVGAEAQNSNAILTDTSLPEDGLDIMPQAGTLTGTGWNVIRGEWVAEEAGLRQLTIDEFDLAASYDAQRFETYALDVSLRHLQNIGGGIYINMQSPDSTSASHMIRFEADGSALFWGYFDEDSAFTGQGYANTSIDFSQTQNLRVTVHKERFDVALNGEMQAEDIPLHYTGGYVGLTATQSDVLFERVGIVPIDGIGTAPAVESELVPERDGLLQQVETISGKWLYEDGKIRQVQPEENDYMTRLNVLGRDYTLSAIVNLPDPEVIADAGAGFIFHMPKRGSRESGHMMRLLDGGERIMWGEYDATGVFVGQGNIRTDLDPTEAHEIAVRVKVNSFDIIVNGETLVTELPLAEEEGWIGLVAYRGVVEFSDVSLTLGGE